VIARRERRRIRRVTLCLCAVGIFLFLFPGGDTARKKVGLQSGAILDVSSRKAELRNLPAAVTRRYCPAEKHLTIEPVSIVDGDNWAPGEQAVHQGLALWGALNDYLAQDDHRAARWAVRVLMKWARSDALRGIKGWPTRARYQMKRVLLPMITAYSILRKAGFVSPEDQYRIEAWLGRGVDFIDRDNAVGNRHSNINNHRYSRDAVVMAWGIVSGYEQAFLKGIAGYRRALAQMRPDGSLPAETARGSKAIHYQNLALSILVPMAEMATHQGVGLYGAHAGGIDIHRAVGFLIRAVDNPKIVEPYAPGLKQELHRMAKHLSWTEIYLHRFPGHANAKGLIRIRQRLSFVPGRASEFSGANLSCLFAHLDTHP